MSFDTADIDRSPKKGQVLPEPTGWRSSPILSMALSKTPAEAAGPRALHGVPVYLPHDTDTIPYCRGSL